MRLPKILVLISCYLAQGLGPHGLMRMMTSDWDDSLHPPPAARNESESVLTASLATHALVRLVPTQPRRTREGDKERHSGRPCAYPRC